MTYDPHDDARRRRARRVPWAMTLGVILLAILAVVLVMLVLRGAGGSDLSTDPPATALRSAQPATVGPSSVSEPSARPSVSASPEPEAPSLEGRALAAEATGLRLRSAPTEEGDILATLPRGTRMGATGRVDGDWVEVQIGPGTLAGWVSAGPNRSWLRVVRDGAIAFNSSGPSEDEGPAWMLIRPHGDGALSQLAGGDVVEIAWSPDGSRVAMTVAGTDGLAVRVANADGSSSRTIGPGGYGPSWSPDGRLAWSSMAGIVIADEALQPTTLQTDIRNPGRPFWSPDSTRLAVIAIDCPECPADEPIVGDVPGAVYVVEVATGATAKLTAPGYYGFGAWSPDGSRVSYSAIDLSGERPPQGFLIPAEGGSPSPVLGGAPIHEAPTWSPDGSRLAMGAPDGLVVMAGDGSNPTVLFPTDALVSVGQWSPSGEWLVFQSSDGPDLGVWIVRSDGSEAPLRISGTEVSAGNPIWQPLWDPLP